MNFRVKRILFNICSGIIAFLTCMVIFATIFLLTMNFVYIQTPIEGYSMLPTLNTTVPTATTEGDIVYINRFDQINRGDIVVAEVTWNDHPIIKRLVGLPGDQIEIKLWNERYYVFVNQKELYSIRQSGETFDGRPGGTEVYFAHYLHYLDEYENGKNYIQLGDDEYFLMGDNWGGTTDSMKYGPMKRSEIVGRVEPDLIVPYGESTMNYMLKFIGKKLFG